MIYNFQRIWLRKISQAYHKRLKYYVINEVHAPCMILNESNGKWKLSSPVSLKIINHKLLILVSNGKFNFTILLKQIPTEPNFYWDAIKDHLHRSVINEFRLGNHRLRIETGRYTALKTPEDLRICSICQANGVENECHVICVFLHSVWYALQQFFWWNH